MTEPYAIIDCQYGSTGKGLLAGYLGSERHPDLLVMAPSPNAGHTLRLEDGEPLVHKMLPLGVATTGAEMPRVFLGPGSLLDLDRLELEIQTLRDMGVDFHIYAHENAGVVLPEHREAEANGGTAPGSTRSGAGAAQIAKIRRRPGTRTFGDVDHPVRHLVEPISTPQAQGLYAVAEIVQVEGCQGYSLSIHHGIYPYVTSRDVTTAQLVADCGMPWQLSRHLQVIGSFRTYPIRVANRPESGEYSGPCYPDQEETTFEAIGQPQEYTTVTKLPRRIFSWSEHQAADAITQCGVDQAFLNFAQYPPTWEELEATWRSLAALAPVAYVGFGPTIDDIYRGPGMLRPISSYRRIYAKYNNHR